MTSRTFTQNAYESALTSTLLAGATSVIVDSALGLVAPLYLVVDPDDPTNREWIRVDTINVNTLENIVRGLEGSNGPPGVGVDHDAGIRIRAIFSKQHLDDLFDDIESGVSDLTTHINDIADPHAAAGYIKLAPADARYVMKAGDAMTGLLILSGDPSNVLGAATKQYVDVISGDLVTHEANVSAHHTRYTDSEAQAAVSGQFLPLSGGAVSGPITLPGAPTNSLHAATKQYVDDSSGGGVTDHALLTNVTTSQHHTKYTDAEAIAAVHVKYTDNEARSAVDNNTYLKLTGGTLVGLTAVDIGTLGVNVGDLMTPFQLFGKDGNTTLVEFTSRRFSAGSDHGTSQNLMSRKVDSTYFGGISFTSLDTIIYFQESAVGPYDPENWMQMKPNETDFLKIVRPFDGIFVNGYSINPGGLGSVYEFQSRNIRMNDSVGAPSNGIGIDGDVHLKYI